MDAQTPTEADADAVLLSDALGVDRAALRPFSREPLGAGTVTGFEVRGAHGADATDGPDAPDGPDLPDGAVAYVDSSQLPVVQETGFVLEGVARVWIHPADPHLPALAPAAYGQAAEVLLARLGVTAETGAPQIVGYRPGRRAVLRVPTDAGDLWVKVVRPRRIERVVAAHTRLREHGLPVPAVRGWSPEGLLVLDSAVGTPATAARWDPGALLDAVDALRARLARAPLDWPARTSLAERLPWYLERLRPLLPQRAERWDALAALVAGGLSHPAPQSETVHGDLHLGQLFVEGPAITGLIDVDTAGRGAAGEDAAAFTAHAAASALLTSARGGDADRVRALAAAGHERWGDDPRTRALTAVHLVGHALGAASAGDVERAARLVTLAETVATEPKRPLIDGFEDA